MKTVIENKEKPGLDVETYKTKVISEDNYSWNVEIRYSRDVESQRITDNKVNIKIGNTSALIERFG